MDKVIIEIESRIKFVESFLMDLYFKEHSALKDFEFKINELKGMNISTIKQLEIFENLFSNYFPSLALIIDKKLKYKLSNAEKVKIKLYYIHNNIQDISSQLGIGQESVRVSFYRIRKKLGIKDNVEISSYLKFDK
jgi:DNA-binding CsgD family transcriptional regulator